MKPVGWESDPGVSGFRALKKRVTIIRNHGQLPGGTVNHGKTCRYGGRGCGGPGKPDKHMISSSSLSQEVKCPPAPRLPHSPQGKVPQAGQHPTCDKACHQPLPSLARAYQGPLLTAVYPKGSQEASAEGTRRRCVLGLAVGTGPPGYCPRSSAGLWAGWRLQQPVPTPGAHPGPQALPEQQDVSWPECPWKEAAYQRGKDTLFRPGHSPRLGVACSGSGG